MFKKGIIVYIKKHFTPLSESSFNTHRDFENPDLHENGMLQGMLNAYLMIKAAMRKVNKQCTLKEVLRPIESD